MATVLTFLVLVMVAAFVLLPLFALIGKTIKLHPRFMPLDLSRLPSVQSSHLQRVVDQLQRDGFEPEAYLRPAEQAAKTVCYYVLLANRTSRSTAIVTLTAPISTVEKPAVAGDVAVTFQTRFSGGTVVETHNTQDLSFTPPVVNEIRNYFPSIRDLHRLYQLHCFALENLFGNNLREGKTIYGENQALEYLPHSIEECLGAQVDSGYLRIDQSKLEHVYRPTPKGAYLVTWCNLFPVSAVRWLVRAIRERELISDFQRSSWGVALR